MTSELTKTSLLIIANIFTGFGASILASDLYNGILLLLIAGAVLVLRGWLKFKGLPVNSTSQ